MSLSAEVQPMQTVLELVCPHMRTEVPIRLACYSLELFDLLLPIESAQQSLHVTAAHSREVINTLCHEDSDTSSSQRFELSNTHLHWNACSS